MLERLKEISGNLLQVIFSNIIAFIIIIPSSIFAAMMLVTFGETPLSTEIFAFLLILSGIIVGSFVGGFMIAKNSSKTPKRYVLITGISILFFCIQFSHFSFYDFEPYEVIILSVIVPSTLLGGHYGLKN